MFELSTLNLEKRKECHESVNNTFSVKLSRTALHLHVSMEAHSFTPSY